MLRFVILLLIGWCLGPCLVLAQTTVTMRVIESVADEDGSSTAIIRFERSGGSLNSLLTIETSFDPTTTASTSDWLDNNGGQFRSFGRVFINSNETTVDLVITPIADNLVEGDERIDITIEPGSYQIGMPSTASITIDDDPPVVSVTVSDGAAAEGADTATLRFARSGGNLNSLLTIETRFDPSTTASTSDWFDNNAGQFRSFGRAFINSNETFVDLVITAVADNLVEGEERIDITIEPGSYQIGTPNAASVALGDDPPVVSVAVVEPLATEGAETAIVRFARSGGAFNQQLNVQTSFDTTTTASTADWLDNNAGQFRSFGLVFIPSNQAFFDLVITAVADNLVEGDEPIDITIEPGSYQVTAPGAASITIADDPPIVSVTVIDAIAAEGSNTATLRFERSGGAFNQQLNINTQFETTTTASTSDWLDNIASQFRSFGFVFIPSNQSFFDLVITAVTDNLMEGTEQLDVAIQPGSYLIGTPSMAGVTILDDPLFSDGFESTGGSVPARANGGCAPASLASSGGEFLDLGPTLLDVENGLEWLRCEPTSQFNWKHWRCSGRFDSASATKPPTAAMIEKFNAGRLGDNLGYDDWRLVTPVESSVDPRRLEGCLVRD